MTTLHLSTSTPGASHIRRGLPCQDSVRSLELGGVTVLVVADGAGSAARSELGSALAVELACTSVARAWEHPPTSGVQLEAMLDRVMSDVRSSFAEASRSVAAQAGCSISDLSTTLAITLVAWPWVAYAGIGDAFLVGCDPDESLHLLVSPVKEGEFRNETQFLGPESVPQIRVIHDATLSGVVLSTDGLEKFIEERIIDDPVGGRRPIMWAPSRTFADLIREARTGASPAQLSEAFAAEEFQRRKGDDIGVSLAWR